MILKATKELEFDHNMGKISDADYQEAHATYRQRAVRILKMLDDAEARGYREIIERELAERLTAAGEPRPAPAPTAAPRPAIERDPAVCTCGVRNDADAAFCKK